MTAEGARATRRSAAAAASSAAVAAVSGTALRAPAVDGFLSCQHLHPGPACVRTADAVGHLLNGQHYQLGSALQLQGLVKSAPELLTDANALAQHRW